MQGLQREMYGSSRYSFLSGAGEVPPLLMMK